MSTPFILKVLADLDVEYAYKLLENEELPGWLYMPKNNATTIWESWEGNMTSDKGIASLNHYSKGALCEWLIGSMCGIKIDGERQFTIAPKVGGSITYAECEYDSIYGKVVSKWVRNGDKVKYTITVPSNSTARIELPNGTVQTVGAGEYEF